MAKTGGKGLVDDEGLNLLKEFCTVLRMSFQTDGLGKIQTENAHDGFGVDGIPSRNQIHVKVVLRNSVHKGLDVIDGAQHNVAGSHGIDLHSVDLAVTEGPEPTLSIITIFTIYQHFHFKSTANCKFF